MRFRVLGPVSLSPRTPSAAKPRALLATLLVQTGEVVPVHSLIDELWGTEPPRTATTTLQVYVSQLRKVLAEAGGSAHSGELLTRAPGYLLAVPERDFDLPCFERLRAEGRAAYQEGDFGRASGLLHEALALWTGPALSGIPHGVRLESAAIRLDELRMEVLEQRIVADLRLGRHQELAGELLALANEHPLRETLHGHLMVALYRTGRGSDALRVYGRLRHSLVEELGV
ncbi:AfsR/SARP family transcriptional regulator, partial [Streptomyces torulosus]|uniref:AfsR/SARP family transcriptional regulator n=1 Tax=Streptomyces torulosus TaxID=68276 RepID=UPI0014725FD7